MTGRGVIPDARRASVLLGSAAIVCCAAATDVALAVGSAPPKTLSKACGLPYVTATITDFKSGDGARVTGAVGGQGRVGVVLANTSDGTMCDWVGNESKFINLLIGKGYRVLLFNYKGTHWGANVVGAAAKLRAMGSTKIVLVGASTGGIVVIGAAAQTKPRPAAVIGLSASGDPGPTSTGSTKGGIDGKKAVAALNIPLLLVAAKSDPYAFAPTQTLFRAAHEKDKELLIVPGQAHAFFDTDPSGSKVDARILAFIGSHTS
jgi:pimeloyl-ACP methyl ester carboxylesterase